MILIKKLYLGTSVQIAQISKYLSKMGDNVCNKLAKKVSSYKKMVLVKHALVFKAKHLMENLVSSQFAHQIK